MSGSLALASLREVFLASWTYSVTPALVSGLVLGSCVWPPCAQKSRTPGGGATETLRASHNIRLSFLIEELTGWGLVHLTTSSLCQVLKYSPDTIPILRNTLQSRYDCPQSR